MTPQDFVAALKQHGSMKAIFRANKGTEKHVRWANLVALHAEAVAMGLMERRGVGRKANEEIKETTAPEPQGSVKAKATPQAAAPGPGEVKRFIFTCAQNNTKLHEGFWKNLLALKEHYKAELHVSRFLYIKHGLGASGDKAVVVKKERMGDGENVVWDERLKPYISDGRLEVAPSLVWCGEMNILPTAVRPLSGLEVYTGRKSMIVPHVKIALESIASTRGEPTKLNYTTGAVTQRNYIQRKAGLKAEFHHCYGALLVEVCEDGWFCRQLHADSEGVIHDLDIRVAEGKVHTGNPVEGITWGDVHRAEIERWVLDLAFGTGGMLDQLRPKHQFLHDVLHFRGRSHHELRHPHTIFKRHVQGAEDVAKELREAGEFINRAARSWCSNVIVGSNHHRHLGRWLEEQDGRLDPINARIWFKLNEEAYTVIMAGDKTLDYFRLGLWAVDWRNEKNTVFLHEDDSYVICPDEHGGIECGQHGDLGPNGSRGNIKTFARLGRRTNIGHSHSAGICDGAYQAGTCGELSPDWTHGPSSWSHSHIVTYPNGKRAIITMWNGRWRA